MFGQDGCYSYLPLFAAVQVLGQSGPGGVMIFFTDGSQECYPELSEDTSYITDPEVIALIQESKVRIITIAMG